MSLQFITIIDQTGRTSSLAHGGNAHYQPPATLSVLGNLPHGYTIRPHTEADRVALIQWLQLPEVRKACAPLTAQQSTDRAIEATQFQADPVDPATLTHAYNEEGEVRAAFWREHPQFTPRGDGSQNRQTCDCRAAFVDFVDSLQKSGQISDKLADSVTL